MRRLSFLPPIVCVLLLIALTACGAGQEPGPGKAGAKTAYKPKLDVKLDVEGRKAMITVNTDMMISPEHYGQARHDGEGHIHMYLDDGEKIAVKERTTAFPDLAPGKHTLKVSLHNNDHTPYDVTRTLEFEIE